MAELPEDKLHGELSKYKCTKDKDIESFLQTKAITYEQRGWCSTYLLVEEKESDSENRFEIEGFFTLSNRVLRLSESVSNKVRKRIFSGVKKKDNYAHFILIGQLGKYQANLNRKDAEMYLALYYKHNENG